MNGLFHKLAIFPLFRGFNVYPGARTFVSSTGMSSAPSTTPSTPSLQTILDPWLGRTSQSKPQVQDLSLRRTYELEAFPYRSPLDMPYLGLIPQAGIARAAQQVGQAETSRILGETLGEMERKQIETKKYLEQKRREFWGEIRPARFVPRYEFPTRYSGRWIEY